jgi:hypothetical protein
VIATGFDGRRRPDQVRTTTGERETVATSVRPAAAVAAGTGTGATIPARDFLEELERQRSESSDGTSIRDDGAVPVRAERSVGSESKKAASTYDADDLEIPSFLRRK